MDKKTLTIIFSVAIITCFFLAYLSFFGMGASGYDLVFRTIGTGMPEWKYVLLIAPLAGIVLLIGALNNEKYPLSRPLFSWLPFLGQLAFAVILYFYFSNDRGMDDEESQAIAIGDFVNVFGYGYWISLAMSLALALYNPKKKA